MSLTSKPNEVIMKLVAITNDLQEFSSILESLEKQKEDLLMKISSIKEMKNEMLSKLIETNGWNPVEINGEMFLPGKDNDNRFSLRKL